MTMTQQNSQDPQKPQAVVHFKATENTTPIDDSVIRSRPSNADMHNAEVLAALAVTQGKAAPGSNLPPENPETHVLSAPEDHPSHLDTENEAELRAGVQALQNGSPQVTTPTLPVPPVEDEESEVTPQDLSSSEVSSEESDSKTPSEPKTPAAQILAEITATEERIKHNRMELQAERVELDEAIAEFRQEVERSQQNHSQLEHQIKTNPLGVLAHYGYDMNKLAQLALASPDGPPPLQATTPQPQESQQIQALQGQIQQLTQMVQGLTHGNKAHDYENGIKAVGATEPYKILDSYPGGQVAAQNAAMELAAGYMKKYGVGPKDFTPQDALSRVKDGWEAHLKNIGAYESAIKSLGISQQQQPPAPPENQPPAPTLTANDDMPPPRSGVEDEIGNHHDEVMRALGKVQPDARRGFN